MQKISCLLFFFLLLFIFSCSSDMTEPMDNSCGKASSFDTNIKPIIELSCAYSGCHNGLSSAAPGNYTEYEGIEAVISNGSFATKVFDLKDNPLLGMPPNNTIGGPSDLTDLELTILQDWINNGYPNELMVVPATYDASVKLIIDQTCAYSGCHDGQGGIGGYTSFEGIKVDIDNGRFFMRVIELIDDPVFGMPPASAAPKGGATELTSEQLELIFCWIENEYPEN